MSLVSWLLFENLSISLSTNAFKMSLNRQSKLSALWHYVAISHKCIMLEIAPLSVSDLFEFYWNWINLFFSLWTNCWWMYFMRFTFTSVNWICISNCILIKKHAKQKPNWFFLFSILVIIKRNDNCQNWNVFVSVFSHRFYVIQFRSKFFVENIYGFLCHLAGIY